jgi:hypothetical protein
MIKPRKNKPTSKKDHVALQMALDLVLQHDTPERRAQVKRMLREKNGWWEAASFCSYHLQIANLTEALGLRPWSPLPCTVDLTKPEDIASPAGQLVLRLDAVGISRYHPDPLQALASGEKRAAGLAQREIMASAASVVPLRPNRKRVRTADSPKQPSDVA